MNLSEKILSIVNSTQKKLETDKVSTILNNCLRIAILRNDFANQWWIKWEFHTINDLEGMRKFPRTIKYRFTNEEYRRLWYEFREEWMKERKIEQFDVQFAVLDPSKIQALSVIEIENNLESAKYSLENLSIPNNLDSQKTYEADKENFKARIVLEMSIKSFKNILGRIKARAAEFLNNTEFELISGKTYSEYFQRTKEFVEKKLAEIAPDVLQKFISIELDTNNNETFAHSLLTCRRILKSFADKIYPSPKEPILGSDGKERILDNEKYIGRIWQFIYESIGKETSTNLLKSRLEDLGHRVDHIYNLTNKGIHADVGLQEANQCIIQTYLIINDILMIKE